jgi:hypothetical protein
MARKQEPDSVSTIVGLLLVNNSVNISSKHFSSVAVMVSQLKRKEEHKDKKFKLRQEGDTVIVSRVL